MRNNEEMAFVYTEMHVFLALYLCRIGPTKILLGIGIPQGNMKLFHAKMKENICTICEIG